jgi:hypothetical protein
VLDFGQQGVQSSRGDGAGRALEPVGHGAGGRGVARGDRGAEPCRLGRRGLPEQGGQVGHQRGIPQATSP